jgi:hypothetical protein
MRSLFTVHIGEFLAGEAIERKFRRVNIWVPGKDKGIDLLVSDAKNKRVVSFQVKFSRDFLGRPGGRTEFIKPLRSCGWWTLKRHKIVKSPADYWVFALVGFATGTRDFVIIKRDDLQKRFDAIHGRANIIQSYFWITEKGKCWETRGLSISDERLIAQGQFKDPTRDFTSYLNNWQPIKQLNR